MVEAAASQEAADFLAAEWVAEVEAPGKMNQVKRGYRMLCKSQSNRAIAGVCGGIAEYFGWNATIVRLFFLFIGIGLPLYIILAIVMPDAESPLL